MVFNIKNKDKEKKDKTFSIKNKKEREKKLFIEGIEKKNSISEKEILLIKRRLNNGTYTEEDVEKLGYIRIEPEQEKKGYDWLIDKWKTPKGVERKNNPFGYREEEVLRTFNGFTLVGFHDDVNYYQAESGIHNYVPIYRVDGESGTFEYYVELGEPKIIG